MTADRDAASRAPALRDNRDREAHRYEYAIGDELGWVSYGRVDGVTTLSHARVPAALAGRGVGSEMARQVLEAERARGAKVRATCSFLAAYLARHPEFDDLGA